MPPTFVYPGTPTSEAYSLMVNPQQPVTLQANHATPPEYEPITLEIDENLDDFFVEPSLTGTYFAMVDLQIGGQWILTDVDGRGLYVGRVASKTVNGAAGTVTYRFNTLMSRLANHEPAGVVISSADANLGENANPNQVLAYLVNRWGAPKEVNGLSLTTLTPTIELRGSSGPIVPYVIFISVRQEIGQALSILEWLRKLFDIFEGYSFRLEGTVLHVTPPMYQQLAAIDLSGALVLAAVQSSDDSSVVNSQTVSHRPYVFVGEFLKDPDGTPAQTLPGDGGAPDQISDLPEVCEPVFYRQGDTTNVGLPDNRRRLYTGQRVGFTFTDDLYPVVPPVRVTWTAYIFATNYRDDGTKATKDLSEFVTFQTHVVDIGPNGAYFDAVTRFDNWINGPVNHTWVWRIKLDKKGVSAILIHPAETLEGMMKFGVFDRGRLYYFGAEFHMNVQSQAWERSKESFTATYGVYTPPTLPPGVEVPPIETASDPATNSTEAIYGRRPGDDKVIDTWSLVSMATGGSAAVRDADAEAKREIIGRTLLDIAQHTVKEKLLPYETLKLSLMRPFPVTARDLGLLAGWTPPGASAPTTGIIRSYSYSEQHALTGSDVTGEISLRVPQTAERQNIIFIPPTPDDETAYLPPGYPADGDFRSEPPVPPGPITAGPGMVQLDLGRRFDILRFKADGVRRIRFYRTDATRTTDNPRAETEVDANGFTVNTTPTEEVFEQLILEARLPYGDNDFLDLHSILGHTPEGIVYANIEGGPITIYRYVPEGVLDEDLPPPVTP